MGALGFALGGKLLGRVVLLKSPNYPRLFSERHSDRVKAIPLGFGWRITIRDALPPKETPDDQA